MAVTTDSRKLYVTRFFAVVKPGGVQADDNGRVAQVCRIDIKTASPRIADYKPARLISMGSQATGFTVDSTGDGVADATAAFPNQLGSIVIKGNNAFLPNIAASPTGPLRFNVNTHAFVNVIGGVNGGSASDQSAAKFLNLHLGARNPEPGKKKLFFANVGAIGFAKGNAYVVSSGSDLLVKVLVAGSGKLSFTVDDDTTRYIDLNDPANPATAGANAGKNPLGIAVNKAGTKAYVMNFVSRNVSVVNLSQDRVVKVVRTTALPQPGLARGGRAGRRGDVLQLARPLRPAGGHHGVHRRAPLQRGLAELRELPLQGPDRRDRVVVQRRPAQVGAVERDVQPEQPRRPPGPELLVDPRRGRGLRAEHPQRVRPRSAGGGADLRDARAGPAGHQRRSTRRTGS